MFVDRQFSGAPLTPIPCPAAIGLGWLPEWHESPTGLLPEVLDWRARVRGTESPRPPGGSALAKHPRDTSSPRIKKENAHQIDGRPLRLSGLRRVGRS